MKRAILTAIAAGLTASAAMATNINISVQQTNGTNAISVAPGASVDYKVVGTLTDNVNEGLALISVSLDFTGGPLTPGNTPPNGDFSCLNPMRNFVKDEGMTNPAGFGGTVIVGSPPCPNAARACLIQGGGAQNTINNTVGNASFPIGAVLTGVAQPAGCGPAVILTGSFAVPAGLAPGAYALNAFDVFANVIVDGEDGTVFWAVEPAGIGTVTPLAVNVIAGTCDVASWASVITHTRTGQTPIDVPLEIPNTGLFSEPRSGIKKIVVTFNGTINAATATGGQVVSCGNNSLGGAVDLSGVAVTAAAVAGNTQMEINFTPALPNFARYSIALDGVECAGGGAAGGGAGGLSRIITGLQGDLNSDRRVNATDVGGIRSLVPRDPINPAILNEVRKNVNNDKRINATDVGGARSQVPNNAQTIPDPVCP